MTILLISDLHLSPERPEVTRAFLAFLKTQAAKAKALYILGDLFEAWVGDDDPAPLSQQVIAALKVLTTHGTELYVMQGNRDFLLDKRFARETGCTLLPDHYVTQLEGHKVLLLHGDTLCIDDEQYQHARRKIRHPLFRWGLNHLPLSIRQKIATNWRAKSMQANANKSSNIMDVTPSEVDRVMAQYQVNTMIHGHTHRPDRHQHQYGERIVLGDWHHDGWYIAIANKKEPELIRLQIEH